MGKIRHFFKSMLGISSSEFSGFTWLVATGVVCILALIIADRVTKNPYDNYEADAKVLDSLLQIMNRAEKGRKLPSKTVHYFEFDPNTASEEQLLQLGFPNWLASQLINYRSKDGHFYKSEDLLKLYNFPDTLYEKVAPYISIVKLKENTRYVKQKTDKPKITQTQAERAPLPMFDINLADTAILQTISGVGSVLSNRIVAYRNKLGGFVYPQQLYEVYNLDTATITILFETAFIEDNFSPSKILINSVDEKQLAAHPYVSWKQAKLIVAYRNQHGSFTNKESLVKVYSLNKEWLQKIEPYLAY